MDSDRERQWVREGNKEEQQKNKRKTKKKKMKPKSKWQLTWINIQMAPQLEPLNYPIYSLSLHFKLSFLSLACSPFAVAESLVRSFFSLLLFLLVSFEY